MKRNISILGLLIALVCIGIFLTHSYNNFRVAEDFTPIPLSFDPYSSTSSSDWNGATVSIQGGFIKGKMGEEFIRNSLGHLIIPLIFKLSILPFWIVHAVGRKNKLFLRSNMHG